MTTIVYRDGVMAADSRAYKDRYTSLGVKMKIRRLRNGTLVGCSTSNNGMPEAVTAWYDEGMPNGPKGLQDLFSMTEKPGFELIAVDRDGIATYIDGTCLPTSAKAPYHAIGSGDGYALGAMAAGKTAPQAVLIACQFDCLSAPPIYVATHDQDPKEYGPLH